MPDGPCLVPQEDLQQLAERCDAGGPITIDAAELRALLVHIETLQDTIAATEGEFCRVCGCTQNNACDGGCWWVEEDLCSSCAVGNPRVGNDDCDFTDVDDTDCDGTMPAMEVQDSDDGEGFFVVQLLPDPTDDELLWGKPIGDAIGPIVWFDREQAELIAAGMVRFTYDCGADPEEVEDANDDLDDRRWRGMGGDCDGTVAA